MRATATCPARPGRWFLALLLALGLVSPVRAQRPDTAGAVPAGAHETLQVGDRILFQCVGPTGARYVGRLLALGEDTLVVALASGKRPSPVVTVPRSVVSGVWISEGRSRRTLAGLGVGLLVGTVAGALLGAVAEAGGETSCAAEDSYCLNLSGLALVAGTVVGATTGLVLGGFAGFMTRGDRWRAVELSPSIVAAQPGGDRFGLAVRVRLGAGSREPTRRPT